MFQHASKFLGVGLLGLAGFIIAAPAVPASASSPAVSSQSSSRRGRGSAGFISTLQTKVGLTPEQGDQVRGILAEQREQMTAIREKSDSKIRTILTSEQQPKFDAFLAELKSKRSPRT